MLFKGETIKLTIISEGSKYVRPFNQNISKVFNNIYRYAIIIFDHISQPHNDIGNVITTMLKHFMLSLWSSVRERTPKSIVKKITITYLLRCSMHWNVTEKQNVWCYSMAISSILQLYPWVLVLSTLLVFFIVACEDNTKIPYSRFFYVHMSNACFSLHLFL